MGKIRSDEEKLIPSKTRLTQNQKNLKEDNVVSEEEK
jgi:hypothetical protein